MNKLAIIGGGALALAAARTLVNAGHDVDVLEPGSHRAVELREEFDTNLPHIALPRPQRQQTVGDMRNMQRREMDKKLRDKGLALAQTDEGARLLPTTDPRTERPPSKAQLRRLRQMANGQIKADNGLIPVPVVPEVETAIALTPEERVLDSMRTEGKFKLSTVAGWLDNASDGSARLDEYQQEAHKLIQRLKGDGKVKFAAGYWHWLG